MAGLPRGHRPDSPFTMKILLIKNYLQDGQYSMLAFADMLERGLSEAGIDVCVASPTVRFGKQRNTVTGLGKWLGYVDKYILAQGALRRAERDFQPDLVHICDHSNAMYVKYFKAPVVLTCNDLIAVRTWLSEIPGQSKSFIGGQQQAWIFRNIPKADRIACISDKTREDLVRLAPASKSKAITIPMGLNYPYQSLSHPQVDRRIAEVGGWTAINGSPLNGPWLLHVGNDGWYKNRIGVVNIWKKTQSLLNQPLGLVLVGAPPSGKLSEVLGGHEGDIAVVHGASNGLLEALYCKAKCLLFPSLAEGYGWPPVEAQACGCPVATSDIDPIRGNCPHALLWNPADEDGFAQQLAKLLADEHRLESMQQAGLANAKNFALQSMIQSYARLYRELISCQ